MPVIWLESTYSENFTFEIKKYKNIKSERNLAFELLRNGVCVVQELRKVDLNAKMSKSKKKKLKKREKRNQQLMEEAMKHAMEAKVPVTYPVPVPLLTNNLFVVKSKTVRLSWY